MARPLKVSSLRLQGRCLDAPHRELHRELGFPEPALVSNEARKSERARRASKGS